MIYQALAFFGLFIAAVALLVSFKALLSPRWILGWLRGSAGIVLVAASIGITLVALDISSYQQIYDDKPIGSISFKRVVPQKYEASVTLEGDPEQTFLIYGDLWQIDAKILRWTSVAGSLGMKPGYRMGRLGGRYFSIEEERASNRSIHELSHSEYGLDMWYWLNKYRSSGFWVEAAYGSATFLPMSDGALYTIYLTNSGIIAKPENQPAEAAVADWQ